MKNRRFTLIFHFFLLASSIFLSSCGELSEQTLAEWRKAPDFERDKAVLLHFEADAEYVKKCITRMAALPGAESVKILDAGRMCATGLRLKEQNAKSKK